MLARRFVPSIGCYGMLSQASSSLVVPVLCGGVTSLQKNQSEILWRTSVFTVRKLQRNLLFMCSGAAKLQNFLSSNLGGKDFTCRSLSSVKILFSLERSRSFACTRSAHFSVLNTNSLSDGNSVSRVSRVGWIDARNALFEYLHDTRNLHFTDAEHMSKNSPVFLQKLLSKAENEEDVGRSVSRLLRYNPINEFEPFFESLGLKPDELRSLLPRNLMFLSDDEVLLDNYHALCYYGVPRTKIGKMYKEGTEMFQYGPGVLSSKLRSYEKLSLSRPTIIKLVTCCPALLVGDVNVDFVWVLQKLRSLGVRLDLIRGSLSDKNMYNWKRILDMVTFLETMGCNKKDLANLVNEHPRFVFNDSGKKIYILVAMLLKLGLKMDRILTLFEKYPRVLVGNFTKNLMRTVHFLTEIGMEAEEVARIVSSHPQVLGYCTCKRPEVVLKSLNLSAERLCEIIKEEPNQLINLPSKRQINALNLPRVEETFLQQKSAFLQKIGFVENSDEMAKALSKFRGRGDQLQQRFDCLVSLGLDYHTVCDMIKLVPPVLNQSTDVIKKKIDYLLNDMAFPLESLVDFPTYLCYNMDKIKLRFSMYMWLKEHGMLKATKNRKSVKSTVAVSTILACSDIRFEKYFVNLHSKGPEVWEQLKRSSSSE